MTHYDYKVLAAFGLLLGLLAYGLLRYMRTWCR